MSREGSVKKDASTGLWRFVVDLTPPGATKRRQVFRRGFKTKREALDALDVVKRQVRDGTFVEPSKLTVGSFITEQWLPALDLRPTTVDSYKRLAELHIIPALGEVRLQALDRATVARWATKLGKTLSPKSVRNIVGVLSSALSYAVTLELVQRNVAHGRGILPKVPQRPPRVWSADQLATFLRATVGDELGVLWRFIGTTGTRRGEALGLRWSDVDLESGTATIAQQRTIAGGRVVEGQPKTASGARTVALDAGTIAALRAWKVEQNRHRLVMGAGWRGELVFTHPDGTGYWPQLVTSRFKATAEALGLPTIGVHGLRHSSATFMIASGINPKVVQQRLGHAHVAVTLALYTHVLPGHDRDAAEALSAALANSREHPVITELPQAANAQVERVRPLGLEPDDRGDGP